MTITGVRRSSGAVLSAAIVMVGTAPSLVAS